MCRTHRHRPSPRLSLLAEREPRACAVRPTRGRGNTHLTGGRGEAPSLPDARTFLPSVSYVSHTQKTHL